MIVMNGDCPETFCDNNVPLMIRYWATILEIQTFCFPCPCSFWKGDFVFLVQLFPHGIWVQKILGVFWGKKTMRIYGFSVNTLEFQWQYSSTDFVFIYRLIKISLLKQIRRVKN